MSDAAVTAEAVTDLANRTAEAARRLAVLAAEAAGAGNESEATRLTGKAEGVRLALSYIDDMIRSGSPGERQSPLTVIADAFGAAYGADDDLAENYWFDGAAKAVADLVGEGWLPASADPHRPESLPAAR